MTSKLTRDERRGIYEPPSWHPSQPIPSETHSARSYRRARPLQVAAIDRGDLAACPYICRGLPLHDPHGTCVFGCYSEPSCHTDGPFVGYGDHVAKAWAWLDELSRSPVWRRLTRPGRVAPPPIPGAQSPA